MKTAIEPGLPKTRVSTKKPSLSLPKPRKKPTDIDRVRSVARRLLKKLESETRLVLPDDKDEIEAREKKYQMMFGTRSTYLSALTSLADLLFKIEQASISKSASIEAALPEPEIPMNPADVALVENFVQRMKKLPEA